MGQREKKYEADLLKDMIAEIKKYLSNENLSLSFGGVKTANVYSFAYFVYHDKLKHDIERFVESDPATANTSDPYSYILKGYKGMNAIVSYRVANSLITNFELLLKPDDDIYYDPFDDDFQENDYLNNKKEYFYHLARIISRDSEVKTSVEINPSATIGKGFVIDHGFRTHIFPTDPNSIGGVVIGETCIIGENCTILNGVVLGAMEVNQGASQIERRHPKIGNNVTICANARIFGAITIGNNVFIGANTVVNHDIPDNYDVLILNQLQLVKIENEDKKARIKLHGLVRYDGDLLLCGKNLRNVNIYLCDNDSERIGEIDIKEISDDSIKFTFEPIFSTDISLYVESNNNGFKESVIILRPPVLNERTHA